MESRGGRAHEGFFKVLGLVVNRASNRFKLVLSGQETMYKRGPVIILKGQLRALKFSKTWKSIQKRQERL